MSRLRQITEWLRKELGDTDFTLKWIAGDASPRKYYRLAIAGETRIVMDSSAEQGCDLFIDIGKRLAHAGLHVPKVFAYNPRRGFLLLSDLGHTLYLMRLNNACADALYNDAINALFCMQTCCDSDGLANYDATLLQQEMALFKDWLLDKHLDIKCAQPEIQALQPLFDLLVDSALAQPRVFVHRDYHSRNLLYTRQNNPGIIDYQDAVYGPISYDLVSLLKDCYIKWPREKTCAIALSYCLRLNAETDMGPFDTQQFLSWFELMGVQRHLKASGIFARLFHRDRKPDYLEQIPRTLSYILDLEQDYPELKDLCTLIKSDIMPKLTRSCR